LRRGKLVRWDQVRCLKSTLEITTDLSTVDFHIFDIPRFALLYESGIRDKDILLALWK